LNCTDEAYLNPYNPNVDLIEYLEEEYVQYFNIIAGSKFRENVFKFRNHYI
jgi:hypothetical protein